MSSTVVVASESVQLENRVFSKYDYMGVSVIKTNDNFFNATKICQDSGISDFKQVARYKYWTNYYELVKTYGKLDHEKSVVPDFIEVDNKNSTVNSQHNFSSDESVDTYKELTDSDLMFEIKLRGSETKWIAGVYIHEILLNKLLMHIDNAYAFRVSYLLNLVNKELHLRNVTLEQKILEQKQLIDKLQEQLEALKKPEVNSVVDKGQYKFEKTDYNGILVLREVTTGYYNASKMCSDNGKRTNDIFGTSYWQEYIQEIKSIMSLRKNPQANLTLDLTDHGENEFRGIYIHPKLVNFLCMRLNIKYAVKVSEIMDMINEELHLRNVSLETKIEEMHTELEQIKDLHEKSGRGKNHDTPGCLLLKPKGINKYKLAYRLVPKTSDKYALILDDVYNAKDTYSEFDIYAKQGQLKNITRTSAFNYIIPDINDFKNSIDKIQRFLIEPPTLDAVLSNLKKSYKPNHLGFQGKMFEVYCSQKFNIPLYPHAPGELLGLSKVDTGLDLLDLNKKIMGQCKYYITSTLSINNMPRFIDFVESYPDFTHKLFVSTLTPVSNTVKENDNIELMYVDDTEFQLWYNERISDISQTVVDKFDTPAHQWLKNELETHDFMYVNDAISNLNKLFRLNITCQHQFAEMFCPIYRRFAASKSFAHDTVTNEAYISNPKCPVPIVSNGKVANDLSKSTRMIYLTQDEQDKEREFLIDTIKYGQYTLDDLMPMYKEKFGRPTTNKSLSRYTDIFKTIARGDGKGLRIIRRKMNDRYNQVYELNDDVIENKLDIIRDFMVKHKDLNATELADKINKEFHRYETYQSIPSLFKLIGINNSQTERNININKARAWLVNNLQEGNLIYEDAIEYINKEFNLNITSRISFGCIFKNCYCTKTFTPDMIYYKVNEQK